MAFFRREEGGEGEGRREEEVKVTWSCEWSPE